jgi:gliding motility-associated-like protein
MTMLKKLFCLAALVFCTIFSSQAATLNAYMTTASGASSCVGNNISFKDSIIYTGSGSITSITWDFGDGNTATSSSQGTTQTHAYASASGSPYTVTLTVKSSDGQTSTATKAVTVAPGVTVDIEIPSLICEHSDKLAFKDSSTIPSGQTATAYAWNFSDGSSFTSKDVFVKVFSSSGNMTVTHSVTTDKGCTFSKSFSINVKPAPLASAKAFSHCADSAIVFDASGTNEEGISGLTYSWSFPDGSTLSGKVVKKVFNAPGSYKGTVTINNPNGCNVNASVSGTAYDEPKLNIFANPTCGDSLVYFINRTTYVFNNVVKYSFNYDISSSNDTGSFLAANMLSDTFGTGHSYPKPGTYTVKVTAHTLLGCDTSIRFNVTTYPTPTVDFSFSSPGCQDSSVVFVDKSGTAGNPTVRRIWHFGDSANSVSTLANPYHKYKQPGTYSVTLKAFTAHGCADSLIQKVRVYPKAVSDFSYSAGCKNDTTRFFDATHIDSTFNDPEQVVRWMWNFGDSTGVDTNQNTKHVYKRSRSYDATLITYSKRGCADTVVKTVTVLPDPNVDFSFPVTNCEGDSIVFVNKSSGDVDSTLRLWEFGDGFSATDSNVTKHVYNISGDIDVSLTVYSKSGGCPKKLTKSIHITPSPIASFNSSPACFGQPTTFTNKTTYSGPGNVTYTWSFGDGSPDTTTHNVKDAVSHTYANKKAYVVSLTSTSDNTGCNTTFTQGVTLTDVPVASFTANDTCTKTAVNFIDHSTLSGVAFTGNHAWDFGDSTTSISNEPTHTYKYPGPHVVKLTVITSTGCQDTYIDTVTTYRQPTADFVYVSHCVNYQPVEFYDKSTVYNGTSTGTRLWYFSDNGTTSTDVNPTHIFTKSGNNIVNLTVTDDKGCVTTTTQNVLVYPKANPVISQINPGCPNYTSTFFGNVSNPSVPVVDYRWYFGDGDSATGKSTSHTYTQGGWKHVTLITESDQGCLDTLKDSIEIPYKPVAKFGYIGANKNETFQFFDSSTIKNDVPSNWTWDFGVIGAQKDYHKDPSYIYTDTGTYIVTLIVSGASGCQDTFRLPVIVYPLPVAGFTSDTVCEGEQTSFTDTSSIAKGYIAVRDWDFGDGSKHVETTDNIITHTYPKYGTYYPLLTVTSGTGGVGRSNYGALSVRVLQKPTAAFKTDPGVVEIQNPVVQFTNTSKSYNNLHWDFGDGTEDNVPNPKHTYSDTGTYIVKLTATNSNGCQDTFIYYMQVKLGYTLFAPNVVTPNGDGVNDVWLPRGTGVIDYDCIIIDRWGQTVFHTTDINQPWKCDYNGNGVRVPEGTYVFYIKAGDFYNEDFKKLKGNITVVR